MVAKEYNVGYTKVAKGGMGNDWIHRQIYNTLPKLVDKHKNILVIAGWSDPQRQELLCLNKNDIDMIASPPFSEDFYKEYMLQSFAFGHKAYDEFTTVLIKSVRALYKSLNVDYIDAFAFTPPIHVDFLGSCNVLEKNFIDIVGLGEGRLYNKETNTWWHQTPIGNRMIADEIIKYINQK